MVILGILLTLSLVWILIGTKLLLGAIRGTPAPITRGLMGSDHPDILAAVVALLARGPCAILRLTAVIVRSVSTGVWAFITTVWRRVGALVRGDP
jgi:hypothetical protein